MNVIHAGFLTNESGTLVYISSDMTGSYEKYGFTKIDELTSYGGDEDSVFAKQLCSVKWREAHRRTAAMGQPTNFSKQPRARRARTGVQGYCPCKKQPAI